jgi:hypothetical protein
MNRLSLQLFVCYLLTACFGNGSAFTATAPCRMQQLNLNSHVSAINVRYVHTTPLLPLHMTKLDIENKDDLVTTSSFLQGRGGRIIGQLFDFSSQIFGFFIQVVSVLLSFGLVLNLVGYGYQVDVSHGRVRIDTLEQLRTEGQFQREIIRTSGRVQDSEQ